MKNIVELMLKYKQVPVAIVGFIVVFAWFWYLTKQITNHLPTQIKEVNTRIDKLDDKVDANHKEGKQMNDRLNANMDKILFLLAEQNAKKDKK